MRKEFENFNSNINGMQIISILNRRDQQHEKKFNIHSEQLLELVNKKVIVFASFGSPAVV